MGTWIAGDDRRRGRAAGPTTRPQLPPFQAVLEAHGAVVRRFLIASVGRDDADDCFQETVVAALRTYPNLRHAEHLRAWLLAIAASKAADAGRSRRRRAVAAGDGTDLEGLARPDAADRRVSRGSDPWPDPDDPLWRAVRALPERQRTAVVLRAVVDRPYAEVAAAMGCSEQTARAHVSQGLARLRQVLPSPATAMADDDDGKETRT